MAQTALQIFATFNNLVTNTWWGSVSYKATINTLIVIIASSLHMIIDNLCIYNNFGTNLVQLFYNSRYHHNTSYTNNRNTTFD